MADHPGCRQRPERHGCLFTDRTGELLGEYRIRHRDRHGRRTPDVHADLRRNHRPAAGIPVRPVQHQMGQNQAAHASWLGNPECRPPVHVPFLLQQGPRHGSVRWLLHAVCRRLHDCQHDRADSAGSSDQRSEAAPDRRRLDDHLQLHGADGPDHCPECRDASNVRRHLQPGISVRRRVCLRWTVPDRRDPGLHRHQCL